MRRYYTIVDAIARGVSRLLVVLLVALVSVVFGNIVLRYLGRSIRWSDEVARLLFVWVSFMGMFVGYNEGAHPSFNQIVTMVSNKSAGGGRSMLLLIHVLVIVFLVIVLYGGTIYIGHARIQTTAVLRMSVGWMYAAAPVSVALMLMEAIKKILLLFDTKQAKAIDGGEDTEVRE